MEPAEPPSDYHDDETAGNGGGALLARGELHSDADGPLHDHEADVAFDIDDADVDHEQLGLRLQKGVGQPHAGVGLKGRRARNALLLVLGVLSVLLAVLVVQLCTDINSRERPVAAGQPSKQASANSGMRTGGDVRNSSRSVAATTATTKRPTRRPSACRVVLHSPKHACTHALDTASCMVAHA